MSKETKEISKTKEVEEVVSNEKIEVDKASYERLQKASELIIEKFGDLPDSISKEETFKTIDYIKSLQNAIPGLSQINGFFNPEIVNDALNRVNNNPVKADQKQIDRLIETANKKESQDSLLRIGDFYDLDNMMYRRVVNKIAHMPSFDLEFDFLNTDIDFTNNQFKSDERKFEDFLNKFDYRNEFGRIAKILTKKEVYYGALVSNEDGSKYTIQEMPSQYCRIDARHAHGFAYSFNMEWFRQSGVDINMYPKALRDKYLELYVDGQDRYDPARPLNKRDGEWTEWVSVSPKDGFWVFKFDESNISQVPFFTPMFRELAYKEMAEELQNNEFLIKASQIIMAVVETQDDSRSKTKDNFELTPDTVAAFSTLARRQIGDLAKFVATPFKDHKLFSNDLNTNNILDDYNKITSTSFGGASTVLYSSEKLIETEAKHAIDVDVMLATSMYPTFENFINYFVNMITTKYKFSVRFSGVKLASYRKEKMAAAREDSQSAVQDYQKQASARGLNFFEYKKRLQYSYASGLDKYMRTFETAYNKSSKNGRPQKGDENSGSKNLN